MLCRSASLTDVATKTRKLSRLSGVNSVVIDLNREIFVNTGFMHSLVRENIPNNKG
jgi:hypothetical protein